MRDLPSTMTLDRIVPGMARRYARRPPKDWPTECELDGIALAHHDRCAACGILIGPGHIASVGLGGRCLACASSRRRGSPSVDR